MRCIPGNLALIGLAAFYLKRNVQGLNSPATDTSQESERWIGVNLSGLEFGMQVTGSLDSSPSKSPPMSQVKHFISENVNSFRIPIAWQRMQPEIMGSLNNSVLSTLETYIDEVTQAKGNVIIDLHNYARRDGKIIGEAEDLPADSLANFWKQIATIFKSRENVAFGIMNEPHDLKLTTWIQTLQGVVTAIRNTGAANKIILSGDKWSSIGSFSDSYKAGLSTIKNPDGSCAGLIFEIHQYFDQDGSGSSGACTTSHTQDLIEVSNMLKKENRQALITEFGGGTDSSCSTILSDFVKTADDAFPNILGHLIWSAGSFDKDYKLVVTVGDDGNGWVDQPNFDAVKKISSNYATANNRTVMRRRLHLELS